MNLAETQEETDIGQTQNTKNSEYSEALTEKDTATPSTSTHDQRIEKEETQNAGATAMDISEATQQKEDKNSKEDDEDYLDDVEKDPGSIYTEEDDDKLLDSSSETITETMKNLTTEERAQIEHGQRESTPKPRRKSNRSKKDINYQDLAGAKPGKKNTKKKSDYRPDQERRIAELKKANQEKREENAELRDRIQ